MPSTARAKRLHEQERSEQWQELRLVEARTSESRSAGNIAEMAGLGLIVLAAWFLAALIFVPQLSGLF
jgi:hypothetical protein